MYSIVKEVGLMEKVVVFEIKEEKDIEVVAEEITKEEK